MYGMGLMDGWSGLGWPFLSVLFLCSVLFSWIALGLFCLTIIKDQFFHYYYYYYY